PVEADDEVVAYVVVGAVPVDADGRRIVRRLPAVNRRVAADLIEPAGRLVRVGVDREGIFIEVVDDVPRDEVEGRAGAQIDTVTPVAGTTQEVIVRDDV